MPGLASGKSHLRMLPPQKKQTDEIIIMGGRASVKKKRQGRTVLLCGIMCYNPAVGYTIRTPDDEEADAMDALEAIRKRRSVRKYTGDPIPREDLETIVDAGRLAATGMNTQPWDFIVVTERETIEELEVAARWMEKAGAIIAVVLDPTSRWWREDGSAAVENMLIASTALGYGSCWLEGNTLHHEEAFKALLGVPDEKRLLTLVPIGVPTEWPTCKKKDLEQVIHWERY
jgi:nitroreductase